MQSHPNGGCEEPLCSARSSVLWNCIDCDSMYCSDCWSLQGPHKPSKRGASGLPHEQIHPGIYHRLKDALSPTRESVETARLLLEDYKSKWIGFSRTSTGRPVLDDFNRLAKITSKMAAEQGHGDRYPHLVSFVGATNAGKSTLVRLLIKSGSTDEALGRRTDYPMPVVSSIADDSYPTTGDIHLYNDPASLTHRHPILYTDCEGFGSGESPPLGAQISRDNYDDVRTREISWANGVKGKRRELMVENLYPRFLYTFSDCVVFVLRNPKTFQSAVLTKLFEWGKGGPEIATNQPMLPHCVVVLNGTDPGVDDIEWDVEHATQQLLRSVKGVLRHAEGVPSLLDLAQHWRCRGHNVAGVQDLLKIYYSSFCVVRIPDRQRYSILDRQMRVLYSVITERCTRSVRSRRESRMLFDVNELDFYVQKGLDHLTQNQDEPFDFLSVSLLRHPVVDDLGGHILHLCSSAYSKFSDQQMGAFLGEMNYFLASCLSLYCSQSRVGYAREGLLRHREKIVEATYEFMDRFIICSSRSDDGSRRCKLVRACHLGKGHQDAKGVFATGPYSSSVSEAFWLDWMYRLEEAVDLIDRFMESCETVLKGSTGQQRRQLAMQAHLQRTKPFLRSMIPIQSHTTCLCCMMHCPEHRLPCGHALCTSCVVAIGDVGETVVQLQTCPLHGANAWGEPLFIHMKPQSAGVRLMSLDDSGVHGIVLLEILREIERSLHRRIPLSSLFDLIVGSGTGGLIALLLNRHGSIDTCVDAYVSLCVDNFTLRLGSEPRLSLPGVSQIFRAVSHKLQTPKLHQALKVSFTEENDLFSTVSTTKQASHRPRVALTTASGAGNEAVILSNYRRPNDVSGPDPLYRPALPEQEIKIWQSAAATLANTSWYKPLYLGGQTFVALQTPNPTFHLSREHRLIFGPDCPTDILISLGTELCDRRRDSSAAADEWAQLLEDTSAVDRQRLFRLCPVMKASHHISADRELMWSLQCEVRSWLGTNGPRCTIRNIALRLLASCFYVTKVEQRHPECLICTIGSRFDGSEMIYSLSNLMKDLSTDTSTIRFRIVQDLHRSQSGTEITIADAAVRRMHERSEFRLRLPEISFRHVRQVSSIELEVISSDERSFKAPISGFPCTTQRLSRYQAQDDRNREHVAELPGISLPDASLTSSDSNEKTLLRCMQQERSQRQGTHPSERKRTSNAAAIGQNFSHIDRQAELANSIESLLNLY